jgi:drug/metabolite transporter (DMT)-like permease
MQVCDTQIDEKTNLKVSNSNINKLKLVLAYIGCAFIWGTTWYAIRVCVAPGGYLPYPGAALRCTLGLSIMAIVWWQCRKYINSPNKTEIRWMLIAGLLGGCGFALLYFAEQQISGGMAAVLGATAPLMAALLAAITRTERPTLGSIAGSSIALLGVACLFHDRLQVSQNQAVAVMLMILNVVLGTGANVTMKKYANKVNPLVTNTIYLISASCFLWMGSFSSGSTNIIPQPIPAVPTLALLYLATLGTALSSTLFFYLLKNVRISTAMTLTFVIPVIALIVDAIWDKQILLTFGSYLGIAIVLTGVAINILGHLKIKAKSIS